MILYVSNGAGVDPVYGPIAAGVVVTSTVIVPPPVDGEGRGASLGVLVALVDRESEEGGLGRKGLSDALELAELLSS